MVTVVEVPSLTFMVSIEPNAMERLSRVAVLAVVMIELRCWSCCGWCGSAPLVEPPDAAAPLAMYTLDGIVGSRR